MSGFSNVIYDDPAAVAQWMGQRRIGSSDAPKICGLSKWGTALSVWTEKVFQLPPDPPTDRQRFGLIMEPEVARRYCQRRPGVELARPAFAVHPEFDWMTATADRISDDDRIVELKTSHWKEKDNWGIEGTDEIPLDYICQVQHQMAVLGKACADVIVWFDVEDVRLYHVKRSNEFIESIIAIEREFWDLVRMRVQPVIDWSHETTPDLIARLRRPTGPPIQLTVDDDELAEQYQAHGLAIKQLERDRDILKAKLTERLGVAREGKLPSGRRVCRSIVAAASYVTNRDEYFSFRVYDPPKPKKKVTNGDGNSKRRDPNPAAESQ